MNNKVIGGLLLVAAIAAIGFFASRQPGNTTNSEGVHVAVNIPLTGPVAGFSGQYANGLQMGVDDACDELGVDRDQIIFDIQDNRGEPQTAATIAQKQAANGFDVYISGVSQMTKAVAPIVDDVCDVHLTVSYDAHLAETPKNRMRILPHFKAEGPVYANYAISRDAKRVFAFTLNNPEIQAEFSEYVQPELEKNGIEFTREVYEFGHDDYRTLALKAKFAKPDVILVAGFSLHVAPILDALRSESMLEDGNVLCIMDFNELLTTKESFERYEGIAYIAPPFGFPQHVDKRSEWSDKFKNRFGVTPNFIPAFAYDTGRMIVQAYADSNTVTPASLESVTPFDGVAGEITLDEYGDLSTPLGVLKVNAEGSVDIIDVTNDGDKVLRKAG
ncbi:ABC transporter substrate-binding protein [Aporhodopirellula aestuarii]|uniref:ABC transporter substrate-binding protein n=1 Tax=Aporhodopirellula aestuarii TaxID=2950107 RepID=A0ABT0UEG5_9BACT|nr:ABC transporter substrate-binding protein [Aporhodopirellula aestuarii]MCM2374651.1 ABC transporter substrate-binding protein [Aporhodopirellula aestuarii]